MNTVTVVGASLAGLHAARELRAQGFGGRLVIIGAEPHPPYDRPPLSKEFLAGAGAGAGAGSGAGAGVSVSAGADSGARMRAGAAIRSAAGGTPAGANGGTPAGITGGTPAGAAGRTSEGAAGRIPEGAAAGTPHGAAPAPAGPDEAALALSDADEIAELAADWMLGVRATGLDPRGRAVHLDDGRAVVTDGVVVATGASARRLPGPQPAGVHTLRTLDDARALRAELTRGPRRVVVIGGGFVGAETASSCAALGHDVTVVEAASLPLVPQLGPDMAAFCAGLHRRGGVRLLTGAGVAGLRHTAVGAPLRVTAVELADGRLLPADVVVVGIGASPHTGWLAGGVDADRDGVHCDGGCVTNLPQVVAVGDVARVGGVRAEHWTSATEQPRVAVRNLLAGHTVETFSALPYFWSDQYGSRIQFAGHRPADATVRVVEGGPDSGSFLAVYEQAGQVRAALAVNCPRAFMKVRRRLRARQTAATDLTGSATAVP